ncbi:hypothetical protein D2E26_1139 [Bifidobacterium dolichotidis]|uniref:Uncharacterized protein n=1 Tax=Bifidobacterium dolichotidis TaxID=2306976 RepID=A0A430FQI9_9BIFI|nr:hypothetical protein [Bifidobacterium dolichotidis]RSX55085.1 hypothetical protein D2E26_1139 [Bifidobacterium dolichotidis]
MNKLTIALFSATTAAALVGMGFWLSHRWTVASVVISALVVMVLIVMASRHMSMPSSDMVRNSNALQQTVNATSVVLVILGFVRILNAMSQAGVPSADANGLGWNAFAGFITIAAALVPPTIAHLIFGKKRDASAE